MAVFARSTQCAFRDVLGMVCRMMGMVSAARWFGVGCWPAGEGIEIKKERGFSPSSLEGIFCFLFIRSSLCFGFIAGSNFSATRSVTGQIYEAVLGCRAGLYPCNFKKCHHHWYIDGRKLNALICCPQICDALKAVFWGNRIRSPGCDTRIFRRFQELLLFS